LLAKPTPHNVNHDNDRFSMFNKKRDITELHRLRPLLRKSAQKICRAEATTGSPVGQACTVLCAFRAFCVLSREIPLTV
jgi:hypothetical protein